MASGYMQPYIGLTTKFGAMWLLLGLVKWGAEGVLQGFKSGLSPSLSNWV